jgi:hypothetical protein
MYRLMLQHEMPKHYQEQNLKRNHRSKIPAQRRAAEGGFY